MPKPVASRFCASENIPSRAGFTIRKYVLATVAMYTAIADGVSSTSAAANGPYTAPATINWFRAKSIPAL